MLANLEPFDASAPLPPGPLDSPQHGRHGPSMRVGVMIRLLGANRVALLEATYTEHRPLDGEDMQAVAYGLGMALDTIVERVATDVLAALR